MSKKKVRHSPEQIVRKLRDAGAMLNTGQDVAAVLQALEVSEATYHRWRNQYGGMKSEEAKRLNTKRVHRLCRKEGLKVRQTQKKRRAKGESGNACHVRKAERKDQVWCWDFAFDRTVGGTTLKWLSIVEEFTRECLALKVSRNVTSEDVIDTLSELFAMRGVPKAIRSDNGPEFASKAIQGWLEKLQVGPLYVSPGSPWENGYAESFHSKLRDEFLSREEFESVVDARRQTSLWREDYNHHRPHSSLGI